MYKILEVPKDLEKKLSKINPIGIAGKVVIPYCKMKETTCFDSAYWDKCKNFQMYRV